MTSRFDEEILQAVTSPFQDQLQKFIKTQEDLDKIENPDGRAVKDWLDPNQFRIPIEKCVKNLSNPLRNELSDAARKKLESVEIRLNESLEEAEKHWQHIDDYFSVHGDFSSFVEAFNLGHAATGAAIGSAILPGIGTWLGAMIGGGIAGSQVVNKSLRKMSFHVEGLMNNYLAIIEIISEDIQDFYHNYLLPKERKLIARHLSVESPVGFFKSLTAIFLGGIASWFLLGVLCIYFFGDISYLAFWLLVIVGIIWGFLVLRKKSWSYIVWFSFLGFIFFVIEALIIMPSSPS